MLASASAPALGSSRPILSGASPPRRSSVNYEEMQEKVKELERYKKSEAKQKAREQAQRKKDLANARRHLQREVKKTQREVRQTTAEVETMERALLKLTDGQDQSVERQHRYLQNYEVQARARDNRSQEQTVQLQDKMSEVGHARGRLAYLQFALRSLDDNLMVPSDEASFEHHELARVQRPSRGPALTEHLRWEVEELMVKSDKLERENAQLQQELSQLRRTYDQGLGKVEDSNGVAGKAVNGVMGTAVIAPKDKAPDNTISRATTSATSATLSSPVSSNTPQSTSAFQNGIWPRAHAASTPPAMRPLTMPSMSPAKVESQASTAAPSPNPLEQFTVRSSGLPSASSTARFTARFSWGTASSLPSPYSGPLSGFGNAQASRINGQQFAQAVPTLTPAGAPIAVSSGSPVAASIMAPAAAPVAGLARSGSANLVSAGTQPGTAPS